MTPSLVPARSTARAALLIAALVAVGATAIVPSARAAERWVPWREPVVDAIEHVAVQDGGRIKPLLSLARFRLLALNGRTSFEAPDGKMRGPSEWLLDVLFRPEVAVASKVFVVQDAEALDAIGLRHDEKGRRDRYSYLELYPARAALAVKSKEWGAKPLGERSRVEDQVVNLASAMSTFENLLHAMDFAREDVPVVAHPAVRSILGERDAVPFAEAVAKVPDLVRRARELHAGSADDPPKDGPVAALLKQVSAVLHHAEGSPPLTVLPPVKGAAEAPIWLSPSDVAALAADEGTVAPEHVSLLSHLAAMTRAGDESETFASELAAFESEAERLAEARGEYGKIGLEVTFYRLGPLSWSLVAFIAAFALLALSWLRPAWPWLARGALVVLCVGLAFLVAGIAMRCVIRERPPISTLYETILFITAMSVSSSLFIEWVNRRGVALPLAALLGALGIFIANRYEAIDKQDTMPTLEAVLDTNFWLWTHVTCINLGYAAALLAGAIAHVQILGKALGLKAGDEGFYRSLAKMTYGVVCFALLFSVIGTILGGIWANESWGRFWGWDPKENGALLIVLWNLTILHARMGGYVRSHGIAMMAVFGNAVVSFSWWGVNLLGVGLHSYGFTSGILTAVTLFLAFEGAVLATGAVWWLLERRAAAARAPAP
jgi:ABC-type transport system involved in cytochrome c biogenesis permease subunit